MSPQEGFYRHVFKTEDRLRRHLSPVLHDPSKWNGNKIRRIVLEGIAYSVVIIALLFVADYVVARHRIAHGTGLGSVNVERLYAIPQKNGKTEFDDLGADTKTCVHSLFPHFGYAPCWDLNYYPEERTNF